MIFLIGGIAKSGKSFVARRMTVQTGIPHFSTDYLMMSLSRGNPGLGVDPEASDEVVSRVLEPYLDGMVQTMAENGIDYILEGVHLTPEAATRWESRFPGKIRSVFLGYRTVSPLDKWREFQLHAKDVENDWLSAYPPDRRNETLRFLVLDSEILYRKAEETGHRYVEIDDIARQADEIIRFLLSGR